MGGSSLGPDGAGFDALGSKIWMSAQRIHRDATDDCDVERSNVVGDFCTIFAKDDIERPVQIVFDLPMAARNIEKLFGVFGCDAGNEMPSLRRGFAFDGALRFNTDQRRKLRPLSAVGKPANVGRGPATSDFEATVALVCGFVK